VLIVLVLAYSAYYRAAEHDWPWQGDPGRLSFCGRDFYPDYDTYTAARATTRGIDVRRLYPVFRAPPIIGSQVYSDLTVAKRTSIKRVDPGGGCGGSLIIKDSFNSYRIYTLSGGP
jgi:hypothetical protein